LAEENGFLTSIALPLLSEKRAVGGVVVTRREAGGFADDQIAMLRSFAEQAVIAISSAKALRALRERTADLQQSLEYQTAISDVLKVIGRSTYDLQPVLDTVVETAVRLCDGAFAVISLREGEFVRIRSVFADSAEYRAVTLGRLLPVSRENLSGRTVFEGRVVHLPDVATDPDYAHPEIHQAGNMRTCLGVPLVRNGQVVGSLCVGRQRVELFTDRQIELVSTFAAQAVIAIENTRLITETREALERQTATAEVLQVINASPGNLAPVFDAMLDRAMRLCGINFGLLRSYDGESMRLLSSRGVPAPFAEFLKTTRYVSPRPQSHMGEALASGRPRQILDMGEDPLYRDGAAAPIIAQNIRAIVDLGGARTVLHVPLVKDGASVGFFTFFRQEVRAFSDKEIALLESFAAQAVIAMENARLLSELRARDEDNRRLIARQSASIEILKTISASPDDPQPVFEMIARRARELCGAEAASVSELDGNLHHMRVMIGHDAEAVARLMAAFPRPPDKTTVHGATILAGDVVQVRDIAADPVFGMIATLQLGNAGSAVGVPLRSEGRVIGAIGLSRSERGGFDDEAVALVESFAEQAVIAISSAKAQRALRARTEELSARQEELRVTFENMGDGVALFDETQHLAAWNRKFQDLIEVPDEVIGRRQTFAEYVRYLAERGEYGRGADVEAHVRRLMEQSGQSRSYERTRPNGRVIEIHHNPVPSGGFVLIYSDITERKRAEAEIAAARDEAEAAARTIEAAYRDLKIAQANLIQAEKMASLGQLTAGIAHEIKNPLNFVNNFSDLSVELLGELNEAIAPAMTGLDEDARADVEDITATLTANLQKITQHGRRADGIVRAMLEHSRGTTGERRAVDLNAEVEEALNLAYHGARAQDPGFNITLERDYADGMAPVVLTPQDITRVFLNLFNNGFYAANKRQAAGEPGFTPTLKVTTHDLGDAVEIRVRDNGTGIPAEIRDKLFQPFFTTKPTGEGTGLGLSISYDVVTKQHGGRIAVDSEPGAFTEFTVTLPRAATGETA